MKNYTVLFAIVLGGLFLLTSCKKEHKTKYVVLNETVKSGAMYSLDVASYGDADDRASITTQAAHYSVSQIDMDPATQKSIYHFSTETKVGGSEQVIITLSEDHGGRNRCDHNEAVITIKFSVQ